MVLLPTRKRRNPLRKSKVFRGPSAGVCIISGRWAAHPPRGSGDAFNGSAYGGTCRSYFHRRSATGDGEAFAAPSGTTSIDVSENSCGISPRNLLQKRDG